MREYSISEIIRLAGEYTSSEGFSFVMVKDQKGNVMMDTKSLIKPLIWKGSERGNEKCEIILGHEYFVWPLPFGTCWKWRCEYYEEYGEASGRCSTKVEAKIQAEAHYVNMILSTLKEDGK